MASACPAFPVISTLPVRAYSVTPLSGVVLAVPSWFKKTGAVVREVGWPVLPLQPVSNYRRRIIEQLTEWLPREKLYAMPRSLQPLGSRALGRLAFVDNYPAIVRRLEQELRGVPGRWHLWSVRREGGSGSRGQG